METSEILSKRVAVIGQGYVGLPLAKRLVDCDHFVIGIDTDSRKIDSIQRGISPIEDVSDHDLNAMLHTKRYIITSDYDEIASVNVVVICVPTPVDPIGSPDYKFLDSAISRLINKLSPDTLIVNESTSSPGTLRNRVASVILNSREDLKGKIFFAVAPERINPGDKGGDLWLIPRVVGALDGESLERASEFYNSFTREVHLVSSPEIAELSKLLENTYRQINISFINQFNHYCRHYGVDTREIIAAASTKPYGFQPFFPSAGIGGHCIPVDPSYLLESSREIGQEITLITEASHINTEMPRLIIETVEIYQSDLKSRRVLIVGLSYKPGLKDLRESPGIRLIEYLMELGIEVEWYDDFHETWDKSKRCETFKDIDIAIICMPSLKFPIADLIESGKLVFDCTGVARHFPEVIQI